MNMNVTVIIPVKNDSINLSKSLPTLSGFDQVMVVDSNSSDNSVKIASKFNCEIYQFEWDGNFPKKRNWALQNLPIRNPWVLFLDSDEFMTEAFRKELTKKIQDPKVDGYWVRFTNNFMGRELKHGDSFSKLALIRLGKGKYEYIEEHNWSKLDMEVHEHIVVDGKEGRIKAKLIHKDFKSLEKYIERHNEYSSWEARRFIQLSKVGDEQFSTRQKLKYALLKVGLLPWIYFIGSYIFKLGFLDGKEGLHFALYKMFYFLQVQGKIREFST